jgi:hypothetical protein
MAINVIAHDTRLVGRTPSVTSSALSFEVDEDTPLQSFFDRCRSIAVENDGIDILSIMAHGVELRFGGEVPGGGYGIMFCHEYITLQNVDLFALLADKVRHIDLYVCFAAAVSPDVHHMDVRHPESSGVWSGDGNEMCRQMAIRAQASVTASSDLQAYREAAGAGPPVFGYSLYTFGDMDFGEWEGTVVTYNSSGEIIDRRIYPTAWRTPDGVVHDPRRETRPAGY